MKGYERQGLGRCRCDSTLWEKGRGEREWAAIGRGVQLQGGEDDQESVLESSVESPCCSRIVSPLSGLRAEKGDAPQGKAAP